MNPRYFIHNGDTSVFSTLTQATIFPDAESALIALEEEKSENVLLCDGRLVRHSLPVVPPDADQYDLLHAGLRLMAGEVFRSLWLTSTNWLFLNPMSDRRCVNWKATPALCLIRPETVRVLGGFDRSYHSAAARLMDLAYRLLVAGGRVCHDPFNLESPIPAELSPSIPLSDEFIFIRRHIGRTAALYVAFWMSLITGRPDQVLRDFSKAARRTHSILSPHPLVDGLFRLRLTGQVKRQQVRSVSAIIPTLNRYEYLAEAIHSLLRQTPKPDEIVVVDQTPEYKRRPEIYEPFLKDKVRVIFMERAGQCVSRNTAIQATEGDWCLLFEDDTVAWDGMLAEHIKAIELSGTIASTGVSLAPWKTVDNIPPDVRHIHLSSVLATGNCLIQKQALLDVGGLDLAFDLGSGADHDLGTRLYLHGYEIIFNPKAIQTHYKAPTGGMRTYGAWWRNYTTFWAPYPQPTQIYTIQRYYPRRYWFPLYLRYYIGAKRQRNWLESIWLWLSAPWKLARALKAAKSLATPSMIGFHH